MAPRTAPDQHLIEAYDDNIRLGLHLASLGESQGGWEHLFSKGDGLFIENDITRAHTAIMLENAKRWMSRMSEATLSQQLGGYRDFVYPIIRAAFPNNPALDLVSVQPQTRKNGTIVWMNYVIGATRGQFKRGQTLFDANNGWSGLNGYTDEKVLGETAGTTAAQTTFNTTLSEFPVRGGTVEITVGGQGTGIVVRDDGNGGFVLVDNGGTALTLSSGVINYNTGAIALTFSANLTASGTVTVDYENDAEGNDIRAQIDVEWQTAGVTAIRRPISMRIPMESMQDAEAELGLDLNQTLITGASQALLADVGSEIIRDLWNMAGTAVSTFDVTRPSGINLAEHFRDLNMNVEECSGTIADRTQRGEATWMVVDQKFANVLRTAGEQAGFIAAPDTYKGQGLVFIGTYNGKKVYKFKYLAALPNASSTGNALLGYKGDDWWDSGYIHAPYQAFYTNGPDERADLTRRQAFAMRYAKKRINNNMYVKLALTAS